MSARIQTKYATSKPARIKHASTLPEISFVAAVIRSTKTEFGVIMETGKDVVV